MYKLYIIKMLIDFLKENGLLEQRLPYLRVFIRNELGYIFRYFRFSLFEYIKFVNEYRGYVKEINDKNIGFYKVYLQYKTPVFFFKIFKMCYWQ